MALFQKYSCENLLNLDHFSSSYHEKNFGVFCMPHSVEDMTAGCY